MSTATAKPAKIKDVVSSLRAVKALEAAGYKTIDDVSNLGELIVLKHVGEVTIEQIQAAKRAADDAPLEDEAPQDAEFEECDNPIHLASPYARLAFRITESGEERIGARVKIRKPKFVSFVGGETQFSKADWSHWLYPDDKRLRDDFVASNQPWRVDAVNWLRNKPSFANGSFVIKSD